MVLGVSCGVIYTLLNLKGNVTTQTSNLLLYSGIVALAAGLIFFATSKAKSWW